LIWPSGPDVKRVYGAPNAKRCKPTTLSRWQNRPLYATILFLKPTLKRKVFDMKKFLLSLALVLAFPIGLALAGGNELAYFKIPELATLSAGSVASGDFVPIYDASTKKTKKVDATTIPFGGGVSANDLVGNGAVQLYGFLQDQVASTTVAVTILQCGKTFVSNSADVMTLPEASTALGCRLTFVCGTADDFDVNPADGTDQISSVSTTNGTTGVVTLAPSAGDAIRCTDVGGSITLEAIGANLWAQVAGGNGIWTDVN
jgi:hypothetical protein